MATCVIFYIRTDKPGIVEKHLNDQLVGWGWPIELEQTSAQRVHDSHSFNDNKEPNWYRWYSYIPDCETYGESYPGHNYLKALAALNGVKNVIADILTTDSTTGEAGEKLRGLDLSVFENGLESVTSDVSRL